MAFAILRERSASKVRAAGVVDDFHPEFKCFLGDSGFVGVDGNGDGQLSLEALQDGHEAAQLLGFGDTRRAWAGGFGTDIDDIGTQLFQLDGTGEGAVGVLIGAAVGEGVGCYVEHAKNESAIPQVESTVAEFPFESLAGH